MDNLTIGKMAKINGVSEQTLRLYDRMQLLVPCEINEETGYRYYTIKQCAQLDMIQYMKAIGMNLSEIKECFERNDLNEMREVLFKHKVNIENQMTELHYAKRAVERSIESYRRYDAAPDEDVVIMEYIKERRIFCYDTKVNCYSYGMETYEHILRSLKKNYVLNHLPICYFCNVGSIIRREYALRRELWATEVFLFVEDDFQSAAGIEIIPEGVYLCTYFNSFAKEEAAIRRLMDFIAENGYEIQGDMLSEVLIEFPTFTQYERNAFIKVQVAVQRRDKIK